MNSVGVAYYQLRVFLELDDLDLQSFEKPRVVFAIARYSVTLVPTL
jgi:hypothetical protein